MLFNVRRNVPTSMMDEAIEDIQCPRQLRSNVQALTDEQPLADNKSQSLIPMTSYLMNANIHLDNEDKDYKNSHKQKANVHTTLTPKTILKLIFFAIYFN